jgi:hypothetical protein
MGDRLLVARVGPDRLGQLGGRMLGGVKAVGLAAAEQGADGAGEAGLLAGRVVRAVGLGRYELDDTGRRQLGDQLGSAGQSG